MNFALKLNLCKMRAKQKLVALGFGFLLFVVGGSQGVFAKEKSESVAKEHVEEIATPGIHIYEVKVGGTLDEFNTADYLDTYGDNKRLKSKFQPNKYVTIKNTGDVDVVNPRIVINGRRNWYSADDILTSILKPGMTDAEKAMAIWGFTSSIEVQCHDNNRRVGPVVPDEKSHPSRNTYKERGNPVKAANCYYCSGCQVSATNFVILCRHAGLIARAVWMCPLDRYTVHCVGEVWYDGGWHLFDPERRSFYLEEDNTTVASYESLHKKPSLAFRTHDGGFASPGKQTHATEYEKFYPPSVMPVEQWLSTMDMTLRPGEKFVCRWDHVHKFRHGKNFRGRERNLVPYQLANGKIIYQARLDVPVFWRGIVAEHNIKSIEVEGGGAKLQPEVAGAVSYVIYKVSSPYPIVGARVVIRCFRKTVEDVCRIYISVHDSDWIELWRAEDLIWYGKQTGNVRRGIIIDEFLDPWPTAAIYNYYLKFELQSKEEPADTSISEIYIETDVQMAATALPSLSVGANRVVYRDQSGQGRCVRITHGWSESSETSPPLAPAKAIVHSDGSEVELASLDKLVWEAANDGDGEPIADYHIQVSPRCDMLHAICPNFDRITYCSEPEWEVPGGWLVKGRDYYWRVRARDKWGAWSNWSRVWKFRIMDSTPAKENSGIGADYLRIVKSYADALLEHGRDTYGRVNSPLIATTLDRKTLKLFEGKTLEKIRDISRNDWGIRSHDRMVEGANPMHDQNLYQVLYALTELTGNKHYAKEADRTLKWFFENCQSETTGLLAWGEHIGWDFKTETVIRTTHEYFRPWVLWERSFELAPKECVRFALGLRNHQISNHQTGNFSRHAAYDKHGPGQDCEFPRHGGFYITTWAQAYDRSKDTIFLKAIGTLVDYLDNRRSSKSGGIPANSSEHSKGKTLQPANNLSLAVDLWDSAKIVPAPLTNKMHRSASKTDEVFLKIRHDLSTNGKDFVAFAHTDTLEILRYNKGMWSAAYGVGGDATFANLCLLRYRQVKLNGYKKLILDAAARYLDGEPNIEIALHPRTLGEVIFLMLGAHGITARKQYLDRADYFAQQAIGLFLDENCPLPKATSKHSHYEAITCSDTLMMALLKLWATKNELEERVRLVYNDR